MSNILIDRHHAGLANSLLSLFSYRLDYNVYFQIGMEWYEKGYWNVYDHIDTAKQYLEIGSVPKDGTPPLNNLIGPNDGNPPFIIEDKHHDKALLGITYEKFEKMDIAIVIASIPQHIKPFKQLAAMKGAKFIFQMGNVFSEVNLNEIPNLLANTLPATIPPTCNYIQYHQEISPVFHPNDTPPHHLITSFINIYDHNKGYEDYMSLKAMMPAFKFYSYGGQCADGTITGVDEMAVIMRNSIFGFHSKYMGDGFGHVLYDWFATGRPVITRISDYKGKLGEELLEDMVTCIDLDKHSYEETKNIIENMKPLHYLMMCQDVRKRFEICVDYEAEAEKIKEWLTHLN